MSFKYHDEKKAKKEFEVLWQQLMKDIGIPEKYWKEPEEKDKQFDT